MTKTWVNYPEFISPQALTAHNLYLQIYITCGLSAFMAFVALIFSSRFWRLTDVAACAALVAILFYGLVDTPFARNDLAAVFWLILAFCCSVNYSKRLTANKKNL
jgi:O-antigen ligase